LNNKKYVFFTPFRLGVVISLIVSYCGILVNGLELSTKLYTSGMFILLIVSILCVDWKEELKDGD
jgi:hypothetical protein